MNRHFKVIGGVAVAVAVSLYARASFAECPQGDSVVIGSICKVDGRECPKGYVPAGVTVHLHHHGALYSALNPGKPPHNINAFDLPPVDAGEGKIACYADKGAQVAPPGVTPPIKE